MNGLVDRLGGETKDALDNVDESVPSLDEGEDDLRKTGMSVSEEKRGEDRVTYDRKEGEEGPEDRDDDPTEEELRVRRGKSQQRQAATMTLSNP